MLSRPERSAKGGIQSPSSLWPANQIVRKRDRIPEHAFSEADRLLARAQDAGQLQHVRQSQLCWRNWHTTRRYTAHDGLIAANHPAIEAALARTQSTTTLQRLLRDPLGFVWRYALGWRSIRLEPEPLQLDPFTFGELVHELISGAITRLEPRPGFARASRRRNRCGNRHGFGNGPHLVAIAAFRAAAILWRHTVTEAARRTSKGLAPDDPTRADTRSWSEVPFGQVKTDQAICHGMQRSPFRFGSRASSMAVGSIRSTFAPLAMERKSPITRASNRRRRTSASPLDRAANCSAFSMRWRSARFFPKSERSSPA